MSDHAGGLLAALVRGALALPWRAAFTDTLHITAFRALPFVCYTLARREVTLRKKVCVPIGYAAVLIVAGDSASDVFPWWLAGLMYFSLIALLVHWVSRETNGTRGIDALMLMGALIVMFLVLPALALKGAAATFLILGWELCLKGYSYVLESGARMCDWRSALHFFIVDPTIVFPHRAQSTPRAQQTSASTVGRALLGLASIFPALLLGHSVRSSSQNLLQTSYIASALVPVSYGVIKILETYALQSGLASLQIGMMRWSGYKIAERYHYPLASRNPIEFWRRWNTYVGNWTRRYLYFPIALRIARRCDLGLIGRAIPVVFAFTAMGALHDVYALVAGPTVTYQATLFFFLNAILLIAWIGITQRSYWASKGRLVETRNAVNPAQSILE